MGCGEMGREKVVGLMEEGVGGGVVAGVEDDDEDDDIATVAKVAAMLFTEVAMREKKPRCSFDDFFVLQETKMGKVAEERNPRNVFPWSFAF